MVNLYFLQYNSYYNRRVIPQALPNWWIKYQVGSTTNVSLFNYGDGVDTTQTVNTGSWANPYLTPDYMVLINQEDGNEQRWYVTEWVYIREYQYVATLKRDLLSEHYQGLLTTPMMMKKGYVQASDSAIFNNEGQSYNQIKSGETLLWDETHTPWVVGFVSQDAFKEGGKVTQKLENYVWQEFDTIADFEEQYPYKVTGNYDKGVYRNNPIYSVRAKESNSDDAYTISYAFDKNGLVAYTPINGRWITIGQGYAKGFAQAGQGIWSSSPTSLSAQAQRWFNSQKNNLTSLETITDSLYKLTDNDINVINNVLAGKTIKDKSTGKLYKIVKTTNQKKFEQTMPLNMYDTVIGSVPSSNWLNTNSNSNYLLTIDYDVIGYTLFEVGITSSTTVEATMPTPANRPHLPRNPYDMFAIPYYSLDIYKDGIKELTTAEYASNIATAISTSLGSSNVYDIMLLPYCPLRDHIMEDGTFNYNATDEGVVDIKITDGAIIGKMFFCSSDTFNFTISLNLNVKNYKVENETDFYRLCSPNYASAFDFNLAKNRGLDFIEVNCTYKPYDPYIHLNPNFKALYGSDYNDQRGLVCGEDFSLPQVTSAWADYQLSNKNYQKSFDREIQSLEFRRNARFAQNLIQVPFEIAGGIMGSVGRDPLSLAKNITSSVGSIANTVSDAAFSYARRTENINSQKDLFNYNLENIQALPQSLSKGTSINVNSKYVPFLEYYTCTEEEKLALADKLQWQGMTIMRVGTISNFLNPDNIDTYIECSPLRFTNFYEDYHALQEIASELSLGVYWAKGGE